MNQPYKIAQRVTLDGEIKTKTGLDEQGREIVDSTPMAPPVGYNKQPHIWDQVRNLVRSEALRQAAEAAGADTFEEADDFDIGEDYDPISPHEEVFDPRIGVGTYDPNFPAAARQAIEAAIQANTPVPPAEGPGTPAPAPAAPPPAPQPPPVKS